MDVRIPWLALIGLCLLVIGLLLSFEHRTRYYPGLLILAVLLALAAALLAGRE